MDEKNNFSVFMSEIVEKKYNISKEEIQERLNFIFSNSSKEQLSEAEAFFLIIKDSKNQIKNIFEESEGDDDWEMEIEERKKEVKNMLERCLEQYDQWWEELWIEEKSTNNFIDQPEKSKEWPEEIEAYMEKMQDRLLDPEEIDALRCFVKEKANYFKKAIETRKGIDEWFKKAFYKIFQYALGVEKKDWVYWWDKNISLEKLETILYCGQFAGSIGKENRDFLMAHYKMYIAQSAPDKDALIGLAKSISQMQENPPQSIYSDIMYDMLKKIDPNDIPEDFFGRFLKALRKRLYVNNQLLELCAEKIALQTEVREEKSLINAFSGLERMNKVPRYLIIELKKKLEQTISSNPTNFNPESFIVMLSGLKSMNNLGWDIEDFFLKKISTINSISQKNFGKLAEYTGDKMIPSANNIKVLIASSERMTETLSPTNLKNFFKCVQNRKKIDEKTYKALLDEITKKMEGVDSWTASDYSEMLLYLNAQHDLPVNMTNQFQKHFERILKEQKLSTVDYKNCIFWLLRISIGNQQVDSLLQLIVKDLRQNWSTLPRNTTQEKGSFLSLYKVHQMYEFYKRENLIIDPEFQLIGEECLKDIKEKHLEDDMSERSKFDFIRSCIKDLWEIYQENFYLGAFECDIYSKEHKLNIEIDWVQHLFVGTKDMRRDQFLREKYGVETIRIQNHRLKNIKTILENYLEKKENKVLYEQVLKDFFKNKNKQQQNTLRPILTKMVQKKNLVHKKFTQLYRENGHTLEYIQNAETIEISQKDVLIFVDYLIETKKKTWEYFTVLAQILRETEKPTSQLIIKRIIKLLEFSTQTSQLLRKELKEATEGVVFDTISLYTEMIGSWQEISKIPGFIIAIYREKIQELKNTQEMKIWDYINIIQGLALASKKSSEEAPEVLLFLNETVKELREKWDTIPKTQEEHKLINQLSNYYLKHRKENLL